MPLRAKKEVNDRKSKLLESLPRSQKENKILSDLGMVEGNLPMRYLIFGSL